jgi:hypothetical protein
VLVAQSAGAQPANPLPSPPGPPPGSDETGLTNLMSRDEDAISTNEMGWTNDLGSTNEPGNERALTAPTEAGNNPTTPSTSFAPSGTRPGDRSSQNGDRFSRRRSRQRGDWNGNSSRSTDSGRSGFSAANVPPLVNDDSGRPAYTNFTVIADLNIFDPNRYPHQSNGGRPPRHNPVVESFALVGVMSYDKGTFAFFDGSSSAYQKALKPEDTIAGYKVASITPDAVQLVAGTNQVALRVGMQLRREEAGEWQSSTQTEAYGSASAATSGTSSVSSASTPSASPDAAAGAGADNDVLKRLMQRREQE